MNSRSQIDLDNPGPIVESNVVGVHTWDLEGRIRSANDYFLNLIGYSRSDLIEGRIQWEILTPAKFLDLDRAAFRETVESGVFKPYEKEIVRKDGSIASVLIGGIHFDPAANGGISFTIDMSQVHTARSALLASERRFRALIDHSSVGIIEADLDLNALDINPTALDWIGAKSLDEARDTWLNTFTPQSIEKIRNAATDRQNGLSSVYEIEMLTPEGYRRTVLVSGAPVKDDDGAPRSMIATLVDISGIKRTMHLLQATADAVPDGILVVNSKGEIETYNQKYIDIWKIPEDILKNGDFSEVMKHVVSMFVHPEEFLRVKDRFANKDECNDTTTWELKDGRFVEIYRKIDRRPGTPTRVICVRGVTDRKRVEERLFHADRMSTVGALAAGVAHEINNPLTHLVCGLELLGIGLHKIEDLREDQIQKIQDSLEPLIRSAGRITEIVKDLRVFSHSGSERIEPVDLQRVIEGAFPLVNSAIKQRARLATKFGAAPLIDANEGRLSQVFVNLLVNAVQSMKRERFESNVVSVTIGTNDRGWACVEISDTGSGIPREDLRKIFEPFYTTKPVGTGTGLGLFICYNIIQRFGGEIEVESEVGKGSTFRVVFPPSAAKVPNREETDRTEPSIAQMGSQTVLVVDDEEAICESIRAILSDQHDVLVARNGLEALEILSEQADRIDLVICDLVMPVMSGVDLFNRVRQEMPRVAERFVFITGGTINTKAQKFLQSVGNPVVFKPFTMRQLTDAVNSFSQASLSPHRRQ